MVVRSTPGSPALLDERAPSMPVPRTAVVSVVIPCYRQAHTLGDALTSVLGQTHTVGEVFVVDDGSPDDVASVVARFPGVHLIRQPNRGLSAARNAGLRRAASDYVAFLDADDVWYPQALAHGLAALAAHPGRAFAAGGFVERQTDSGEVLGVFNPCAGAARGTAASVQDAQYAAMLRGNFIGMHGAVLYRRAVLLGVGGFREALPSCEDWDVYLRLLRQGPAALYGAPVAEYRRHAANMSWDHARMLAGAHAVLHAQRASVRARPALRAALAEGMAHVRALYAVPLLERVRRPAEPGGLARVVGALAALARYEPAFLAGRLVEYGRSRALRSVGRTRVSATPVSATPVSATPVSATPAGARREERA